MEIRKICPKTHFGASWNIEPILQKRTFAEKLLMICLENDILSVKIRRMGAELNSLVAKGSSQEYLWQGDPAYWTGQAPVLFPIVGALKDKSYRHNGQSYTMPQHGFARNNPAFEMVEKGVDFVKFRLHDNEATRMVYPFEFELSVTYALEGNSVKVTHQVVNRGDEPMYFSLGGHPAFRCPMADGEGYDDYYLDFGKPETDVTWQISPDGLISLNCKPMLNNQQTLPLHTMIFDKGALIFKKLKSREVALVSRRSGKKVKVAFADFPYMGLWAKPGAPFVCIEPWHGIADSIDADGQLAHKELIIALPAGEEVAKTYSISVF